MPEIIGVGDANVDVMISVPALAAHDQKVRGRLAGYYPGGIIANFCAAAASFGASVGAVCKVGTDSYGVMALEDLRRRGVDVSHMAVDAGVETYFCVVLLDGTGEKALTIVETSGFLPQKEDVDLAYLRTAGRVHLSSLDMELVDYVTGGMEGSGVKCSLDIEATAGRCPQAVWDRVLHRLDVAFPNEEGLRALTGEEDPDAGAAQLLERGVGMVVVTCGARGCRVYRGDRFFLSPAYAVEVKDTTGAGDCFNAVFLSCLTRGWAPERAAKYAAAAAAIAIGAVGSRTALPTLEEVEVFITEKEATPHAPGNGHL